MDSGWRKPEVIARHASAPSQPSLGFFSGCVLGKEQAVWGWWTDSSPEVVGDPSLKNPKRGRIISLLAGERRAVEETGFSWNSS